MNNFPLAGNIKMPKSPYNPKKQPPVLAGDIRIDPSIKKSPQQPVLAGLVTPKREPKKTNKMKVAALIAAGVALLSTVAAVVVKRIKKP